MRWLVLIALLSTGCIRVPPESQGGGGTREVLGKYVPAKAQVVVAIHSTLASPALDEIRRHPQMRKEFQAYFKKHFGPDFTKIRAVVGYGWFDGKPEAAILFHTKQKPEPFKGNELEKHQGASLVKLPLPTPLPVVVASTKHGLVVGSSAAVKAALDQAAGGGDPSPLLKLFKEAEPKADLVAAADFSNPLIAAGLASVGVGHLNLKKLVASISLSPPRVAAKAEGSGEAFKKEVDKWLKIAKETLEKVKAEKEKAVAAGAHARALPAIYSHYTLEEWLARLKTEIKGDWLSASLTMPKRKAGDAMIVVGMAGILAAVAIPSFVKYTGRAKTVEVHEGLDKIKIGASAFFQADHYDRNGNILPKTFPPSVGWTPKDSCCKGPSAPKCTPRAIQFNQRGWRALQFQLSDPHYYQYRFTSRGKGRSATFVAEARGDLDCDGQYSNYKMLGSVNSEFSVVFKGPIVTNELE